MKKVVIIDYGIGNILSVQRAFEHCNADVTVTDDHKIIANAQALVLPGVGAFKDGMIALKNKGIVDAIEKFTLSNRPFLGICLGMQMMMDESEEFGIHTGLGIINGIVKKLPNVDVFGKINKIPFIGWNGLINCENSNNLTTGLLKNITDDDKFYFVHSYSVMPDKDENRYADTIYGGHRISAIIKKNNLYGCQFHPEKSGESGLKIIKNFIEFC